MEPRRESPAKHAEDGIVITIKSRDPNVVVAVVGELDADGAPRLDTFLAGLDGNITLDCSALAFIDSQGLNLLVKAHRRMSEDGHQLMISALSPECRRPFEITKLDEVLHLTE
jgi:anti-anti-sigma factor